MYAKQAQKSFRALSVGDWMFSTSWDFWGNFWWIKCEFFVTSWIYWDFFGDSLGILCGSCWKVIWIWKEFICLTTFWFLSRFCLIGKGRTRSLEVREASSSHLKTVVHKSVLQRVSFKKCPWWIRLSTK